jgi:hypothetical protein
MDDIVDRLNNGEDLESLKDYFGGDFNALLSLLYKRNLLHLVEINSNNEDDLLEDYIQFYIEKDKTVLYPIIRKYIEGIEIIGDEIYLNVWDIYDLVRTIFKDKDRYCLNIIFLSHVLQGEENDDLYGYGYNKSDEIKEVLDYLDESNINYLKKIIVDGLDGVEIEPGTDLLETFADENNLDYAEVGVNNINQIMDDHETLYYLFEDYLTEIGDTLSSIYGYSYNSAAYSEIYNDIINAMSEYFVDFNQESLGKRIFYRLKVVDFWYWFKTFRVTDMIYYGSYLDLLDNYIDRKVCVSNEFYPDYKNMKYNINQYFKDYL